MFGLEKVYALDVGTRNVVLLSAEKSEDNKIKISNMINKEHETRSMLDGQIHDIAKVAEIVGKLKTDLEAETGEAIKSVAVAVAGRSLVTSKGKSKKSFDIQNEIGEDDILAIELVAIQEGIQHLEKESNNYHCVGYTVTNFILDGVEIKNPLYQKGHELEVEVLATFLPKMVVDSMYTMLKKVDLNIVNLTLEPIAAINVVVPEDMRKLNIVLVDIGAGTSDIAITKEGRVIGYGMVPMAGDEITEKVEQEYLLDFVEAEKVKKALRTEDTITYTDVLGIEMEAPTTEMLSRIEPVLENLGSKIAEKILELNGGAPQAVILIGGGSLVPGLREKIADKVSLVSGRVAVRGTEAIKNMVDETARLNTAEFVTPVGIANMAFHGREFNIFNITIDNEAHRVFSFSKKMTLMEALLSSGIQSKDLYSKAGESLTISVNGKMKIFKGEFGKRALVKVNGRFASLDRKIKDGDVIEIKTQRDGRDAVCSIKDLKKEYPKFNVNVNNEKKILLRKFFMNGKELDDNYMIQDRDAIEFKEKFTVADVFDGGIENHFAFKVNGQETKMSIPKAKIFRGEEELSLSSVLELNDKLRLEETEIPELKIKDILEIDEMKAFRIKVNEKDIVFENVKKLIKMNGIPANAETVIENNAVVTYGIPEENMPIVSDIFKYYNPEKLLEEHHKGILKIMMNGEKAEFMTKLENKAEVKLFYL